jgi:hypothetical protein
MRIGLLAAICGSGRMAAGRQKIGGAGRKSATGRGPRQSNPYASPPKETPVTEIGLGSLTATLGELGWHIRERDL